MLSFRGKASCKGARRRVLLILVASWKGSSDPHSGVQSAERIHLANVEFPNAELPNAELLNAELLNAELLNAEVTERRISERRKFLNVELINMTLKMDMLMCVRYTVVIIGENVVHHQQFIICTFLYIYSLKIL